MRYRFVEPQHVWSVIDGRGVELQAQRSPVIPRHR
jgi:hypothetical protein